MERNRGEKIMENDYKKQLIFLTILIILTTITIIVAVNYFQPEDTKLCNENMPKGYMLKRKVTNRSWGTQSLICSYKEITTNKICLTALKKQKENQKWGITTNNCKKEE